jgi:methylmalonyl-CoA/ethylmalonyl-CoA epimerase
MDHIGYAVRDIETSAAIYTAAGWTLSPIYEEEVQRAKIAFLRKEGMTTIELVSPLEGDSPVDRILRTQGVAPYHICYVVDDIMQAVEDLYAEGFKPLFLPVESIAMGNRKICYLYHNDIGYIELVSAK